MHARLTLKPFVLVRLPIQSSAKLILLMHGVSNRGLRLLVRQRDSRLLAGVVVMYTIFPVQSHLSLITPSCQVNSLPSPVLFITKAFVSLRPHAAPTKSYPLAAYSYL